MKLKTYHAWTMNEALAAVKQDLGQDAVILHTRTFQRGGILGFFRKTIVEVTATPAKPAESVNATPSKKVSPAAIAAKRAYGKAAPTVVSDATDSKNVDDESRERTRRLALALEEAHRRKGEQKRAIPASIGPSAADRMIDRKPPSIQTGAARRFVLSTPNAAMEKKSTVDRASPMHNELSAIKQMVGQVLQRQRPNSEEHLTASSTLPAQLFEMYLRLVSQDMSNELADQIVTGLREELSELDLDDPKRLRQAIMKRLASFVPVCDEGFTRTSDDGRPLIVALIGPTGVGKTTTLAKLAATYKLRHGKNVGLITVDTYRIAAVDQLRTYADIIDVPMHVATTPAELKRAIGSLIDRDVILIDTAGRSQRDSNRLAELKRFIAAANPHEVHLVLSGTASEKVLLQEAEAFSNVGIHKIVLTKLDEAVSFGMLLEVVRKIGRQLSFITTGQEVPEHLEIGSAERLASMVLGEISQHEQVVT